MTYLRRVAAVLTFAALAAVGMAGCASRVDGSPQSRPSAAGLPDRPSPSVADSAGPPVEGSGGPADATKIDPCSLVTKGEADQLSGVKLQPAVRSLELCTFPTPTSGTVAQLEVFVGDGAKKYLDIDKINLQHPFHRVPNLGDEAWAEDGAIFVQANGIWFALRLTRLDEVDTGPALVELATSVAGRI